MEGLYQDYATAEDIQRLEERRPIEERLEGEYRRGYRDGWIQAVLAMHELMFRKGLNRQAAYDACYDFWEAELLEWAAGDCSQTVWPPSVEGKSNASKH